MEKKQQSNLNLFLKKYEASLSQQVKAQQPGLITARILHLQDVEEASINIKNGELVAFPTQTVYGLGANALNPEALKRIYQTKKRPLTDPIIVHILDGTQAEKYVEMNQKQKVLFELLTKQFWPGPLTIILKANLNVLPAIVTAQTGFVGIRAPKHPFARKLIEASGLPIGAPSANLFSHVSPTEPVHVFNDFFNSHLSIVDGERCEFGVQSTVIKLFEDEIHVLRQGSLAVSKLQTFLKSNLPQKELPAVIIHRKVIGGNINMQAPGQLLKHYAPYLPCFFFSGEKPGIQFHSKKSQQKIKLSETAFISFDKKYSSFQPFCKNYFEVGSSIEQKNGAPLQDDLFCSQEEKVKMREIYYLLRHCENLPVSGIVIGWSQERQGTLWDKIFRSTQGDQVDMIFE